MAETAKCEDKAQYRWSPDASADGEFTLVFVSLYGKSRNMATEDGSYYIFKQRPDGDLDAFLVQNWYDFTMHSTPTADEAKAAWSSSSRWGGLHTERKSKTKPNSTDTGRGKKRIGITKALEDSDDSDDSDYSDYEGLEVDCRSENSRSD